MNDKKSMNFNDLEQWLNERRVTEVECLVPDLTGVARGKILKIGSQIEPLPLRLQFSKVLLQHGFQILVGELPENTYRPGETLDLQVRAAL